MEPKVIRDKKHAEDSKETQHRHNSKASRAAAQNTTHNPIRGDLLDRWWNSESLAFTEPANTNKTVTEIPRCHLSASKSSLTIGKHWCNTSERNVFENTVDTVYLLKM